MKTARTISGILVMLAFAFSWLFALTCINRIRISFHRDQYRQTVFKVVDAEYFPESDLVPYWLTGTVEGHTERLIPKIPREQRPSSMEELLAMYPQGSAVEVLYNPNESTTLVQGESLRVLHFTPTFWDDEDRLRNRIFTFVFVPGPVAFLIYLCLRILDKFIDRSETASVEVM